MSGGLGGGVNQSFTPGKTRKDRQHRQARSDKHAHPVPPPPAHLPTLRRDLMERSAFVHPQVGEHEGPLQIVVGGHLYNFLEYPK